MIKTFTFKFLISLFFALLILPARANTFVSLSPVPTEIIYALGAQDKLLGVSSACDYPAFVKNKTIIGDTYFVNMEKIIELKPDYLLAMNSARPMLGELKLTKTKPVYFEFSKIEDIYSAIRDIAKLLNKQYQAENLIDEIQAKISKFKTKNPKNILYIVQTEPLITIGSKSFITDVINAAGHKSVTSQIDYYYPAITLEFAHKTKPDVIIICFGRETKIMRKMFPKTQFVYLNQEQRDLINRPAPRVWQAVKFFAEI